jgi:acetoacetate decarboxylase
MTRPVTAGKAGPSLEPGGTFGATLAVNDRRVAEGRFGISGRSDSNGLVNNHPMLHSRLMPSIEIDGRDALDKLIVSSVSQVEVGERFSGNFGLSLIASQSEGLHRLPVREKIGGYWRDFGRHVSTADKVAGRHGNAFDVYACTRHRHATRTRPLASRMP